MSFDERFSQMTEFRRTFGFLFNIHAFKGINSNNSKATELKKRCEIEVFCSWSHTFSALKMAAEHLKHLWPYYYYYYDTLTIKFTLKKSNIRYVHLLNLNDSYLLTYPCINRPGVCIKHHCTNVELSFLLNISIQVVLL